MEYRIVRSNRKTVSVQITSQGELVVRCPNRMRKAQIHALVESKRNWVEQHLQKIRENALPPLSAEEIRALTDRAKSDLAERAESFAPLLGVSYGKITIRSQHTRWGSCSSRGDLSFNCLLMLTSPEVRDYVVVHELCHRKQMNHSRKFWEEVEKMLPDYRENRKWLKENGSALIARLP